MIVYQRIPPVFCPMKEQKWLLRRIKGELQSMPRKKFESIDDYIRDFPPDVQKILENIRATIHETAPGAQEAISYGIPTFRLHGNLVHFAAFKNHIGFYPTASGIEEFEKELAPYKHAKGSVQFPIDKPIPYDLIRKMVQYRAEESLGRGQPGSNVPQGIR